MISFPPYDQISLLATSPTPTRQICRLQEKGQVGDTTRRQTTHDKRETTLVSNPTRIHELESEGKAGGGREGWGGREGGGEAEKEKEPPLDSENGLLELVDN